MKTPQLLYYDLSPRVTAFSSTRHGGYGTGTYAEWNINRYSGDDAAHIEANRAALLELLGISSEALIMPHQNHGTNGVVIDDAFLSLPPEAKAAALEGRDYIATDMPGICIGVSTADCVPILLCSATHGVIIAIHAGWRGTLSRIASIAVRAMAGHYGFAPSSLCAVIGPSISQAAFEVGDEVYDAFRGAGFDMDEIAVRIGEKWHIDLWRANEQELTAAGVRAERIHTAGICTWTHHNDFFSARREGIRSGRIFSGLIIKS